MNHGSIRDRIKRLICDGLVSGVSIDDLTGNTALIDDLQLDSVQMIELISRLEGEFSIELQDQGIDFEALSTINSLAELVREKQARQA